MYYAEISQKKKSNPLSDTEISNMKLDVSLTNPPMNQFEGSKKIFITVRENGNL